MGQVIYPVSDSIEETRQRRRKKRCCVFSILIVITLILGSSIGAAMLLPHESLLSSTGENIALPTDLIQLLNELMDIVSTTGEEGNAMDYLYKGLAAEGWIINKQPLPGDQSRYSIYATRQSTEIHVPRLVFNSHVDTVPPYFPFSQDEQNIYGRGSCDAKGQVACMIQSARRLITEHPDLANDIGLLFVVGEEVDHAGMIYDVEESNKLEGLNPEYLVVGEPTEMKWATLQKGALKVLLSTEGKAGHSGYNHTGYSAIHAILPVLTDISQHQWPSDPVLGDTTFNIGTITGGQALNAWASSAEAKVFFRVTTSVRVMKQKLEGIVNGRAKIEYIGENEPVKLSIPPFDSATAQVSFNTDLPFYKNIEKLKGAYLFGAGSITTAHSDNEFVPISELHECVKKHVELVISLLKN